MFTITALRKARKNGEFENLSQQEVLAINTWLMENGYEPLWADYPLAKTPGFVR